MHYRLYIGDRKTQDVARSNGVEQMPFGIVAIAFLSKNIGLADILIGKIFNSHTPTHLPSSDYRNGGSSSCRL